jgi:hypothetical protein
MSVLFEYTMSIKNHPVPLVTDKGFLISNVEDRRQFESSRERERWEGKLRYKTENK